MLEQLKEMLNSDSRYKYAGLKTSSTGVKDEVFINKTSKSEVRLRYSYDSLFKAILMDTFGELYIEIEDKDVLRVLKGRIALKSTNIVVYF